MSIGYSHSSGRREPMANREDISAHGRHPPAGGVSLDPDPRVSAHQFQSIGSGTRGDEVHDRAVFHPLGNHREGVQRSACPCQWQHVWVFELLP